MKQTQTTHFFFRYNLTRERMFRQENYRPGKRSWIYNQEHLTLKCIFIIEQFNNPINYLKVIQHNYHSTVSIQN